MPILDRLSRIIGRRGVEVRTVVAATSVLGMDATQLYRTQPALRAVISFLADNAAHLPLKCYVRKSDTDRPRDVDSDLAKLVATPSATMTEHELIRATASDFYLFGWALWCVLPSDATPSGWSVTPIPVAWRESVSTLDGLTPSSYAFVNPQTGARFTLDAADCIRFCCYDPRNPSEPHSPVEALKQTLAEQINAYSFRNGVWKNGGRVSAYLYRPKDAAPWGDGGRERFAKSWKAKFSGRDGTDTGGTPLLEDGMEYRTVQFNAKEAEWAEATKLAREDVAAIYHVDQSLVWHGSSQTYASVKDSARSLYADTMGPFLNMLTERINQFLVPKLGLDPSHYVEFDIDAKLQGDFASRASVMQSSTGGPWLTRNEARAWMNLPAIEGADELIVPLNVVEGGLASPNDTDPTVERYGSSAPAPRAKARRTGAKASEAAATPERKSATEPDDADLSDIGEIIRRFTERQRASVLNAVAANPEASVYDLFDQGRWDRELADDLAPAMERIARRQGSATLRDLGVDAELDEQALTGPVAEDALFRAHSVNWSTLTKLAAVALGDDDSEQGDGLRSTMEGVFDEAATSRADRMAGNIAAATRNAAAIRTVDRHARGSGATKTWVTHSAKPRKSHRKMRGETVPYDALFSNGARWPGDVNLDPEESCNCRCTMEIKVGGAERERVYGVPYEDAMVVDEEYIESDEFASKFTGVTGNPEADATLLEGAIHALKRNSGKKTESMTLVDVATNDSVTVDCDIDYGIVYNDEVREFIAARRDGPAVVAAVHNHPNGMPPSLDDLSKAAENNYAFGMVAGHNGQVYWYGNYGKVFTEKQCDGISDMIYMETHDFGRDVDRVCTEMYAEHGLTYELR